ncbi:hypothetical protein V4Y02_24000, partial [Escherichia coli]
NKKNKKVLGRSSVVKASLVNPQYQKRKEKKELGWGYSLVGRALASCAQGRMHKAMGTIPSRKKERKKERE